MAAEFRMSISKEQACWEIIVEEMFVPLVWSGKLKEGNDTPYR